MKTREGILKALAPRMRRAEDFTTPWPIRTTEERREAFSAVNRMTEGRAALDSELILRNDAKERERLPQIRKKLPLTVRK
jgi:hypothetical protein